ncbi:MAG TPA: hypothetical protein VHM93_17560 [Candidatus Acidoferrum sp.]|jgi:MFS family permease|nr:hypothetical protein [Candidatus Acidoferrum sp.]
MADVTLRPMTLGQVLDTTFSLYKRNFWLFAGITALPFFLVLLFQIIIAALGSPIGRAGDPTAISADLVGRMVAGAAIGAILYLVILGYTQAATIFAVSDLYLARSATVRGSFGKVGAKILRIMLIFLIAIIAGILGIFVVALVLGIIVAIVRSPLVIFPALIVVAVPVLLLFCRLALWIPSAMLENVGAVSSFQRSMHLTQGYAFQIFLIYLLVGALTYAAILIFQLPFFAIAAKTAAAHQALPFGVAVLQHLGGFVSNVLVGPIGTIAVSLMYYNVRVRKEAFDIQHLMNSLPAGPSQGAAATT